MSDTKDSESEQNQEKEISERISFILSKRDVEYRKDVIVGSGSFDFYVVSPSTGSSTGLEVKLWEPSESNIERASNLAAFYGLASGVDTAFVILPDLDVSRPEIGVVAFPDLDQVIEDSLEKKKTHREPTVRQVPKKKIFAAMPFAGKYDDTFVSAMRPASLDANVECVRVDLLSFTGDIVDEIKRLIKGSIAVIADLSESRPNVIFEIGYAEGLGKPVVQICSTPLDKLPFTVSHNNTIEYEIGQSSEFKNRLASFVKDVL